MIIIPWPWRKTVFLVGFDGELHARPVTVTQAGLMSAYLMCPCILNPDGTTSGTDLVKGWLPRSGWKPGEHPTLASKLAIDF